MAKRRVVWATMAAALAVGGLAAASPARAEERPRPGGDSSVPATPPTSRAKRPETSRPSDATTKPTRPEGETLDALRAKCATFLEQQGALANTLLAKVQASALSDADKAALAAKITAAAQKVADARAALAAATDRAGIVGACEGVRALLAAIRVPERRTDSTATERKHGDEGVTHALDGVTNSLARLTALAAKLDGVSASLNEKGADTAAANTSLAALRADLAAASAALDAATAALGDNPTNRHAVRDALEPVRVALDAARRDAKAAIRALRAAAHDLHDTTSTTVPSPDTTLGQSAGAHG